MERNLNKIMNHFASWKNQQCSFFCWMNISYLFISEILSVLYICSSSSDDVSGNGFSISVWEHRWVVFNFSNSVWTIESSSRFISPWLPVGTWRSECSVMVSDRFSLIISVFIWDVLFEMVGSSFFYWSGSDWIHFHSNGGNSGDEETEFHCC